MKSVHSDLSNTNPKPSSVTENSIVKKSSSNMIYPCCCGVKEESFYNVFTILIMIDQSFKLLAHIYLLVTNFGLYSISACLISLGFLGWAACNYYTYKKTQNYSSDSDYFFSLALLILICIFVGLLIFFAISLFILGTELVPEFNEMTSSSIFLTFMLFVFPLYFYGTYLVYLYFMVIKNERSKRKNELSREINIDLDEIDTVDNQEKDDEITA